LTKIEKTPFIAGFFYFCTYKYNKYILMGKGDKKTAKGKRFKGSFGKTRPQKATSSTKKKVKAS
jgi:30S ribosomal protein S31